MVDGIKVSNHVQHRAVPAQPFKSLADSIPAFRVLDIDIRGSASLHRDMVVLLAVAIAHMNLAAARISYQSSLSLDQSSLDQSSLDQSSLDQSSLDLTIRAHKPELAT